jgi:hypothetical protein
MNGAAHLLVPEILLVLDRRRRPPRFGNGRESHRKRRLRHRPREIMRLRLGGLGCS